MNPRLKRLLLTVLALVLLGALFPVQRSLNADRERLGLTRVEPLENAPPVLAFTTVALGGFRGLISNALWMRAMDLQDDDKYFEMAQLADWITKLEPHYVQVWIVQAWNMAYNISVKFNDYPDRWRWVERGITLLRDEGLRYNPNEIYLYGELAWFFQHKLGANLDDANTYYKGEWLLEMQRVFGRTNCNFDELISPKTPDQARRAALLRDAYKMDPKLMKEAEDRYGPLEWRLPEAQAIYWAFVGLKYAEANPTRVNKDEFIKLRRVIYQTMQLNFQQGRLVFPPSPGKSASDFGPDMDLMNKWLKDQKGKGPPPFGMAPNLDIIPKTSSAYEQAAEEDPANRVNILQAHRNFLRDAVYFLYGYNRLAEAKHWFDYIGAKYPDKTLVNGDTNSYPGHITLDDYAYGRIKEDVGEANSQQRVKAIIEALITQSYIALATGQDERAAGFKTMAKLMQKSYEGETQTRTDALPVGFFDDTDRDVLSRLLDPNLGGPFEMRAALRYKLGMAPEAAPAPSTNAPPQKPSISSVLKDHQIVPMDHLDALEFAAADLAGVESRDSAGKLGAVEITDADHFASGKLALAPGDAGRQEAFAILADGLSGPGIHKYGALWMVKEGNPAFAPLQAS